MKSLQESINKILGDKISKNNEEKKALEEELLHAIRIGDKKGEIKIRQRYTGLYGEVR